MNDLILKPGRERSLLRRHPWIFSRAFRPVEEEIIPGSTVRVMDSKGNCLGMGAYSPASRLSVRMWSFQEREIGKDFFAEQLKKAYALRKQVFGGSLPEAYRLVCAESDGIPGLIVDIYGKYAVCQFSCAGTEFHKEVITELLLEYAEGIYERSDVDSRVREGLDPVIGQLAGVPVPEEISFSENGIRYIAYPKTGHKTGFYLDQRLNRKTVMEHSAGVGEVLNCFCYTGGFGLAAVNGGAKHVLNVDYSGPALKLAERNAAENGFSREQFEVLEADVFQYLRRCRDSRKRFDMIILDPPKFAETEAQAMKAARGYKDINLLAMKLLNPGGKLFTFSCSGAMTDDLFRKVVDSAAADAGIDFRITHWLSQGPDHPVSAAYPEGYYLKGLGGIVC
ncbi:MAG: class I SAM-dependent rRNA methyltransferase [Lentisphaeria bacterium]|nr:class I SAM-dependent rRNA methyltransferase [Lentisphaeria bacterium]